MKKVVFLLITSYIYSISARTPIIGVVNIMGHDDSRRSVHDLSHNPYYNVKMESVELSSGNLIVYADPEIEKAYGEKRKAENTTDDEVIYFQRPCTHACNALGYRTLNYKGGCTKGYDIQRKACKCICTKK